MYGRAVSTTRAATALGVVLIVVLAVALLASGCGSSSSGTTASGSPAASGSDILRVASLYGITTWDPRSSYSTEVMYLANCYEPLVYANPAGAAEPFSPGLALSWTPSSDGLSWTFKLREGVKFHDGTPFNAAAVKYSIDSTMKLNLGAAYLLSQIKEVKVVDDYTVEFVLSSPAPIDRIMSGDYAVWMYSPATKGKNQAWWDKGNEAGTGPYMLTKYVADQEIDFKANPDWWGGWKDNQFKQIVVQLVGDAGTQRQLLESGAVDTINLVARDQIDALKANPDITVYTGPSLNSYLMFFNTQRKPLDNEKVRVALSYAVPYADLITVGAGGFGTQSRGPVPIDLWPNTDGTVRQYTTDYEKAKQLLADAGYPGGGFTLELTYTSENSNEANFTPLIKEAFAKVGVTVNIKALLNTADAAKARGNPADRQDLAIQLWWPSYPDGIDNLKPMFGSETEVGYNWSYWYNTEFDKLIAEGFKLSATDPTAALVPYDKAQNMLVDQAVAAFLFDDQTVAAHLANIKYSDSAINFNYPQVQFWTQITK
jgi:peptide/nickel transport system substrate-binding protein